MNTPYLPVRVGSDKKRLHKHAFSGILSASGRYGMPFIFGTIYGMVLNAPMEHHGGVFLWGAWDTALTIKEKCV